MSFSTCVIGSFDCNDRVHTFLVSSEYPGQPFSWDTFLGDDLPRQGKRQVGGYWAVPFSIRIQGDTPDDLEARINALRAEIPGCDAAPETNTATIGQPNRSHVGTLIVHASPRSAVPVDVLYTKGESAQVSFTLTCDPYVYSAAETMHSAAGIDCPAIVPLTTQTGQFATPLDLLLDAGALELSACYVGHTKDETAVIGDFVKPLVAASWLKVGGGAATGAAAADAAGYPAGAGNTVWETKDATGDVTPVDVTDHIGEYAVFANVKYRVGAAGASVKQQFGDWVPITTAALKLLYLGTVSLPTQVVRGAATSTLAVSVKGNATNYAAINHVTLVPVSDSIIGWKVTSGHAHKVLWEDGTLYADDVAKLNAAFGGSASLRTLGGQLLVLAEQASSAPTSHLHVTASATPRFEQFPSSPFDALVLRGEATEINPTTDTGYSSYGALGRLFLPDTGTIVCDGNSLTIASGMGQTPYPTQLGALLGGTWNVTNVGVSGQNTAAMLADAATQVDVLCGAAWMGEFDSGSVVVCWEGTNDLCLNEDPHAAYGRLVTYCQGRRAAGFKAVILTITPRSNAGVPGSFEANRQILNALIRAGWPTFADALADVAADPRLGDAGDETDATYYLDLVHMTTAGYAIVASIVKAAINTLGVSSSAGSRLEYPHLGYITKAAGTIAGRAANKLFTSYTNLIDFSADAGPNGLGIWQVDYTNITNYLLYTSASYKRAESYYNRTIDAPYSVVARHGTDTVDLLVGGVAAAQQTGLVALGGPVFGGSVFAVGGSVGGASGNSFRGTIGPLALCPYRLSDDEAALLDAGLTAGWNGLHLFYFFRDLGYTGTLILPLEGSAKGYVIP